MQDFAPFSALAGGLLIGLAAAILWVADGRIAGISGIFGRLLGPRAPEAWRHVFLAAMILGALAASFIVPGLGIGGPGGAPARLAEAPKGFGLGTVGWLAIAGLLTGFGTRLANGCTSGHGVCGLARLSLRSLVAVGIFFAVAVITVTVTGVAS